MFVHGDTFELSIYYKKLRHTYEAISQNQYSTLDDEKKAKYTCLNFTVKVLTWGLYNQISEMATDTDSTGSRIFNYKRWKEEKLKNIIVSWDAKMKQDGEMIPVPLKPANIEKLSPSIAEAMLQAYDEEMSLGEDDEKK